MGRLLASLAVILLWIAPAGAQSRRVAVLDFVNTTRDPALDWLGPAAADDVTTRLHGVRALQLVERSQLYKVLAEQRLGLSDLVDASKAVQLGKLLGAEQLVIGGYAVFGNGVRFNARFVDVESGTIVATSQVGGHIDRANPDALWKVFEQLAQATIDSLNARVVVVPSPPARVDATAAERARILRATTTSLDAQESYGRGLIAYREHQWTDAVRHLERAATLDSAFPAAWLELGNVLRLLGRWPQALAAQERARAEFDRLGDERGRARSLRHTGTVHVVRGDYGAALNTLSETLRVFERLGDASWTGVVLADIGYIHLVQARMDEASAALRRALQLAEASGDRSEGLRIRSYLAQLYARQERATDALREASAALADAEALAHTPAQVRALNAVGSAHLHLRSWSSARVAFERSLGLSQALGDIASQARSAMGLAYAAKGMGNLDHAVEHGERSLRLAVGIGDQAAEAGALNVLGDLHEARGRHAAAAAAYDRALGIATRIGLPEVEMLRDKRDRAQRGRR